LNPFADQHLRGLVGLHVEMQSGKVFLPIAIPQFGLDPRSQEPGSCQVLSILTDLVTLELIRSKNRQTDLASPLPVQTREPVDKDLYVARCRNCIVSNPGNSV
jgi:hypothetical protein